MKLKYLFFLFSWFFISPIFAQSAAQLQVKVTDLQQQPLPGANVELLKRDSSLLHLVVTNAEGIAQFNSLPAGTYIIKATRIGHQNGHSPSITLNPGESKLHTIALSAAEKELGNVTVSSKKPMLQFLPDKTVINVDASISNVGTSVLEVLEKSPGVTTDRDGNISLKGKPGVMILIDGKPTHLAGMDLQNLLAGMSSSQIETIELMDNPSARYDAAGNAGIINIKTKKSKQRGFNGNLTFAQGYGFAPRNNTSLNLNWREGKFNFFANFASNIQQQKRKLYAMRTYYGAGRSIQSLMEQHFDTYVWGQTYSLVTGFDYYASKNTTIGVSLNGLFLKRRTRGDADAFWMDENKNEDSVNYTYSLNHNRLSRGGVTFNIRHVFNAKQELSADIDYLQYSITNKQYFENRLNDPAQVADDITKGEIPSSLNVYSAKVDYTQRFQSGWWEAGWKSSRVETDNLADYKIKTSATWEDDLGKSNHFLYTENIHAMYANGLLEKGKWMVQAGLRMENTSYKAKQLGNAQVSDSSFNRNYVNLFPSAFITYQLDSSNSFTVRAGKRIDRPAFQKLNPFTFIINKYTLHQGNPYFKPQFTWNFELSHQFKDKLTTTFSYNIIRDYISQVFYDDPNTGMIVYTEGNIGEMQNLGLSVATQLSPAKFWTLSAQVVGNYKQIEAMLWKRYRATIWQAQLSMNNQFRFGKGWGAELSGFYLTRNQNDIQEILDPSSSVNLGISKQILKNAGSLRFSVRDVFYKAHMAGWTDFEHVQEYFRWRFDTRVLTLAFSWRFGKAMKQTARRNIGSATDIQQRVGTN